MLDLPPTNPDDSPDARAETKSSRADELDFSASPELEALLLEWEERNERGEAVTLEDLCASTPQLLD
jgi:hypothetical protein